MRGQARVDSCGDSARHLGGVGRALLVQAKPLEQALGRRIISHATLTNEAESPVQLRNHQEQVSDMISDTDSDYIPNSYEEFSDKDMAEENISMYLVPNITKVTIADVNIIMHNKLSANISRPRVKRQNSGAGKFADASKMPQIKLLRLFLQIFKNFWDSSYVGGAHPLHPNVPKTIVTLYKEKVVEFFIPDVGDEKDMAK
ncbi:unnamed protein product [Euphydryas editha]|uniref:Uncharacterized protein n=1 Tax=Euphydryas editha TaxID=104508 RepID=A0AAU9US19_EUPED|nr:unnamed protein product [Euphydryas editha]